MIEPAHILIVEDDAIIRRVYHDVMLSGGYRVSLATSGEEAIAYLQLITPDLIPDEADEWLAASAAHGLDRIFLVAPSSTEERIASTAAPSPPSLSPLPTQRPAAMAPASVTRTSSRARLRSGASRRDWPVMAVIVPLAAR